jgi:hypothetical protein
MAVGDTLLDELEDIGQSCTVSRVETAFVSFNRRFVKRCETMAFVTI